MKDQRIPYSPNMYKNNNPQLALFTNIVRCAKMYGAKEAFTLLKQAQCFGDLLNAVRTKKKAGKKNRQQRIAARARKAAKEAVTA